MDEKIEMLHKLCKVLTAELEEYSKKIEKTDGMSAGDLEAVDKLSHALKSIKTTIAMMEAGEDGGYSGRFVPSMGGYYAPGVGMSYAEDGRGGMMGGNRGGSSNRGGNSYENGNSYARGRGINARRDSMGRYSRNDGYSYAAEMDSIMSDLEGIMEDMPADKQRRVQQLMDELRR